jgi:hypothetical protein
MTPVQVDELKLLEPQTIVGNDYLLTFQRVDEGERNHHKGLLCKIRNRNMTCGETRKVP